MLNKKWVLAVAAGIVVAAAVIGWLFVSGDDPITVKAGKGVTAQVRSSMKNSVLKREQDGRLLWEFTVAESDSNASQNQIHLKGIKGKIYRNDGSYIDVTANKGSAIINREDFTLEGKVRFVLNTGGYFSADKVNWKQKTDKITARGHVKFDIEGWKGSGDAADTTSAFEKFKLKGKAMVEKGGNDNENQ